MKSVLGERIVKLRTKQHITQIALAKSLGITKSMLSKYENSINDPKSEVVSNLADSLHTSTDYLLGKVDGDAPYTDQGYLLSTDELELIELYRELSKENKKKYLEIGNILRSNKRM